MSVTAVIHLVQFSSVAKLCLTLCDSMNPLRWVIYCVYENRIDINDLICCSLLTLYGHIVGYFVVTDKFLLKCYLLSCKLLREGDSLNSSTKQELVGKYFLFSFDGLQNKIFQKLSEKSKLFLYLLTQIIAMALGRHLTC